MTYRGRFKNGVVVLEGDAHLPEGTEVRVEPVAPQVNGEPEDLLFRMGDLAVNTGIPDLATNLDHYLYGHPKAKKGE
jgi:hypothetical protein